MKLTIVVAFAKNRVIGIDNKLPWNIPADLKHFREVTTGKPVLMGRKTFESIGRPLPNRKNIIVTRDLMWDADGVRIAANIEDAIYIAAEEHDECMIIGGAMVYEQCLPYVHAMELTLIDDFPAGDAYFPSFSWDDFNEVSREDIPKDGDTPAYSFVRLERKAEKTLA